MPDYTDNHGLASYNQGDSDWTHSLDMETLEVAVDLKRARAPDTAQETPHNGAVFWDTSTGEIYIGDGTSWGTPEWNLGNIGTGSVSVSDADIEPNSIVQHDTQAPIEGHIVEAFESGDLSHYSGDTDGWTVGTSDITGGDMLQFDDATGDVKTIWTDAVETRRGERYMTYLRLNADGSNSPVFIVCGQLDGGGALHAGYGIGLAADGNDARLIKEPTATDEVWFANTLDTATMAVSGGVLYRLEIDLEVDGTIRGRVSNVDTGRTEATLEGTDTEFESGVVGYRNATSAGNDSDFDVATRSILETTHAGLHTPDIDRLFVRDTDPSNDHTITERDLWLDTS